MPNDSHEALALLNDEPIYESDQDGLALKNLAKAVAGVAIGTEGPFTVGIFGAWGVGKTSVLRLAKKFVDDSQQANDGTITTIMFNAWQYEKEDILLVPLLATILKELMTKRKLTEDVKSWIKKLGDAFRSLLFGISAKTRIGMPEIGDINFGLEPSKAIERYQKLQSKWIDQQIDQSLYYNAFRMLEDIYYTEENTKKLKVVVFIDDLDRCFPDQAIRLLESIKVVLCQSGFIFVLAVDKTILESFLDKRHRDDYGLKEYRQGQSYLDKIIQLPLWIPSHDIRFEGLIEKLLSKSSFRGQKEKLNSLKREISLACEHNPRQLVRFLNDLLVDQRLYELINAEKNGKDVKLDKTQEFPLSAFIVARGIRHQSEFIYQYLLSYHSICKEISECKDFDVLQKHCESNPCDIFFEIKKRIALSELLVSDAGKEWLKDPDTRKRVENFFMGERKHDTFEKWRENELNRLEKYLNSGNKDKILTACLNISVLKPIPDSVLTKLHDLALDKNEAISNSATETLRRIGDNPDK